MVGLNDQYYLFYVFRNVLFILSRNVTVTYDCLERSMSLAKLIYKYRLVVVHSGM